MHPAGTLAAPRGGHHCHQGLHRAVIFSFVLSIYFLRHPTLHLLLRAVVGEVGRTRLLCYLPTLLLLACSTRPPRHSCIVSPACAWRHSLRGSPCDGDLSNCALPSPQGCSVTFIGGKT